MNSPVSNIIEKHKKLVIKLAKKSAPFVFSDHKSLSDKRLKELAHEIWWDFDMLTCESEGVNIQDEAYESLYVEEVIRHYQSLLPESPNWETPRVAKMFEAFLATAPSDENRQMLESWISEADLDENGVTGTEEFCILLEYCFGAREEFPTTWPHNTAGTITYYEVSKDVWGLLFPLDSPWNDFQFRLCHWIWQIETEGFNISRFAVYGFAGSRAKEQPEAETYADFVKLAEAFGDSEEEILEITFKKAIFDATQDESLTSVGRYLLSFPVARSLGIASAQERVSHYAELLIKHKRDLFDQHFTEIEQAIGNSEGWKINLIELMLNIDKEAYETTVIKWSKQLAAPTALAYFIIFCSKAYGDKYKDALLLQATKVFEKLGSEDKSVFDLGQYHEYKPHNESPNSSIKLCLLICLLKNFHSEALEAISNSKYCANSSIDYLEILARYLPGNPKALDQIIAALNKGIPNDFGGLLTRAKYLKRLVIVLQQYSIDPYKERIAMLLADVPANQKKDVKKLLS